MGGSAQYSAYNPVTNPYSDQINNAVPNLTGLQTSTDQGIMNQGAQGNAAARGSMQAQGLGGTELNSALRSNANATAGNLQSANNNINQQDMNNRLGAMAAINGPLYNQSQANMQNTQQAQGQQNSEIQGGASAGISLASLIAMLA